MCTHVNTCGYYKVDNTQKIFVNTDTSAMHRQIQYIIVYNQAQNLNSPTHCLLRNFQYVQKQVTKVVPVSTTQNNSVVFENFSFSIATCHSMHEMSTHLLHC